MWDWGGHATVSVGVVALCMSSAVYVSLILSPGSLPQPEIEYIDAVSDQRVALAPLEEVPVLAVQGRIVPKGLPLACDNTLEHPYFLALRPVATILPTTFYVHCPASCSSLDGEVFGTGQYAGKSSVCLAAIHGGAIDARGGVVQLEAQSTAQFLGRGDRFTASSAHGIHSKSLAIDRTQFTVQPATDLDATRLPALTVSCTANTLEPQFANRSLWLVRCPAQCNFVKGKGLLIWGGHPYTSDSSVCFAAIHAGVGSQTSPSSFVVEQVGGQQLFRGSTENGVTTRDWKMFPARFFIYDFGRHVTCGTTFEKFFGTVDFTDRRWKVVCPANCISGMVYGGGEEGVYAGVSSLCRAAQHAGFLSELGGEVEVQLSPHATAFSASLSNGIQSHSRPAVSSSFTLTQSAFALKCDTSLTQEDDYAQILFTSRLSVRVSCPFGCERTSGPVRGAQIYDPQSSICLSAVHAGAIRRQEGGEFLLIKLPDYSGPSISGSSRNGIISDSLKVTDPMLVFSVQVA